jgi:predicted LPLAT superfamily acyltransferase
VGDCYPPYSDVVDITEMLELLPGELVAIVGDDRVEDPKAENNVLDKTHCLLGANFGQGPYLDPLSELVNHK